jgi:hypothetical protein
MSGFLFVVCVGRSGSKDSYCAFVDCSATVFNRGIFPHDDFQMFKGEAMQLQHAIKTTRGNLRLSSLDFWSRYAAESCLVLVVVP